jgi:hypothetical protein
MAATCLTRFRGTKLPDADAIMWHAVIGMQGVFWISEGLLVSCEMLRQAQHDRPERRGARVAQGFRVKNGTQLSEDNLRGRIGSISSNGRDACSTRRGVVTLTLL